MIDSMDQGIGRILTELKRQNEIENTLILYLQDNGGCAETMGRSAQASNAPTQYTARPEKPVFERLADDALHYFGSVPKQTRDGWPVIMGTSVMPGPADTYIAYGRGWANVSNTPFREYKHWVHEGGISTPLIVHWPRGIPASRRNAIVHEPSHLIDLMATCVDVSGAVYPSVFNGEKIHRMEGVSLRPALSGKRWKRPEPLFWELEGNRAIRDGRWKLVAKENEPWELYDISVDRTETNDWASRQPKLVKSLSVRWEEWAVRANVLPLGTWRASAKRSER
jgi:arylsulfatase